MCLILVTWKPASEFMSTLKQETRLWGFEPIFFCRPETCCTVATRLACLSLKLDRQPAQQQLGLYSGRFWLWCVAGEQPRKHLVQKKYILFTRHRWILGFQVKKGINLKWTINKYWAVKLGHPPSSNLVPFKPITPSAGEGSLYFWGGRWEGGRERDKQDK